MSTAAVAPAASARRAPAAWRRYARHRGFATGFVLLAILTVVALAAPLISPHPPLGSDLSKTLQQPSWQHWLGTDQYGRDVLSRLIWGAHVSLQVSLAVVGISLTLGTIIGAAAGYIGGWTERVIVAGNDILLAFPGFLLALALVAVRGSSLSSIIIAVAIAYTPRVASVMRSVVLTIRPRPFIEASRSLGMGDVGIVLRHVLPNALPPVIVVATVSAASAILSETGLSFLGLGVQAPTPTWGNIIADSQSFISTNPWISLSAGLCIATVVIALNLLGDGLRDTLDPQMRRQTGSRML
jgi:peptide/nickel transport system permease protein